MNNTTLKHTHTRMTRGLVAFIMPARNKSKEIIHSIALDGLKIDEKKN